jgi:hypothetical protein
MHTYTRTHTHTLSHTHTHTLKTGTDAQAGGRAGPHRPTVRASAAARMKLLFRSTRRSGLRSDRSRSQSTCAATTADNSKRLPTTTRVECNAIRCTTHSAAARARHQRRKNSGVAFVGARHARGRVKTPPLVAMRRNRRRHDCAMTSSRICPRPQHPPRASRAAPCRRACRRARPSGRASMRCMRITSAHVRAADTSSPQLTARSSLGDDPRTLCRYITEASMPGREQHVGASSGPKVARSTGRAVMQGAPHAMRNATCCASRRPTGRTPRRGLRTRTPGRRAARR